MSTYKVKIIYKCGHISEFDSDVQKPDQKIDVACPNCRNKQKQEQEKKNETSQLTKEELTRSCPKLRGTEKQIEFAEKNRAKFIAFWSHPDKGATYKQAPIVRTIIENEKKAAWWLDNMKMLCTQELIEQYSLPQNEDYSADTSISLHESKKKLNISKFTLKPQKMNNTGNCIFIQLIKSDIISATLLQPADEMLHEILTQNHFTSNGVNYERKLSKFTGKYEDRAAQLGIQLLRQGYIVVLQNTRVIEMIRQNSYLPENDKWVKYFDEGHCYLDWNGFQKVLCNRALMTIYNAKWNNDYKKVVIPYQSASQLLKYIESNGFSVEDRVLKKLMEVKETLSRYNK